MEEKFRLKMQKDQGRVVLLHSSKIHLSEDIHKSEIPDIKGWLYIFRREKTNPDIPKVQELAPYSFARKMIMLLLTS